MVKIYLFLKIGNKTEMSVLTMSIQYCSGGSIREERNENHPDWKEDNFLQTTWSSIQKVKSIKNPTRSKFTRVTGYNIDIHE